jgi:hypothetical protein
VAPAVFGLALLGCACTSTSSGSSAPLDYYVSLGDSYAAGYQPSATGGVGTTSTNGFAYQVVGMAPSKGYHFTLANFGCNGATTTSLLNTTGCPNGGLGPGGIAYPTTTQASAAQSFLRSHRGHVGLVTVSIGGNDITHCAATPDPTGCAVAAIATIKANVATLAGGLRGAAGPTVQIVGITYPDVLLGLWVATPPNQSLATLSVTAFKSLLNPALQSAYEGVHGTFVDVTAATGAYTPLDQTTTLAPYGTIPVAVAKACELTFYCEFHDIHPMTPGYTVIAQLVVGTLPKKT